MAKPKQTHMEFNPTNPNSNATPPKEKKKSTDHFKHNKQSRYRITAVEETQMQKTQKKLIDVEKKKQKAEGEMRDRSSVSEAYLRSPHPRSQKPQSDPPIQGKAEMISSISVGDIMRYSLLLSGSPYPVGKICWGVWEIVC